MRFLHGHDGFVQTVVFAPDGMILATGGQDATIRLWSLETGGQCGQFHHERDWVSALAFSADGTLLASGGRDRILHVWDCNDGKERRLKGLRGSEVGALAFAPHGFRLPGDKDETLAFGRYDGIVGLWPLGGGDGAELLREGGTAVFALAFAPDGRTLSFGGDHSVIQIWDIASRRRIGEIATTDVSAIRRLAYAPQGGLLAAALGDGPAIFPLSGSKLLSDFYASPRWPLVTASAPCVTSSVAFTPDGQRLLAGGWDGTIGLFDLTGGSLREVTRWKWGHQKVFGVAVSPDGMLAAAVGEGPDPVVLWDLE